MNATEVSSKKIEFEQEEIQVEVSDVESFTDPESVVKSHFTVELYDYLNAPLNHSVNNFNSTQ